MPETIESFDAEAFLIALGKTLGKINLYSFNHPLVRESIQESLNLLVKTLSVSDEMTIAWTEDKLVVNGSPLSSSGFSQGTIGGLFEKYNVHSLTFKKGVTVEELIAFYRLLTTKQEMKSAEEVKNFLESEKVSHIQVDVEFFAKVGKQKAPSGPIDDKQSAANFIQSIEEMPLENMMWQVIQKAVPNPEDQKKIYDIIFHQIENELKEKVERATQDLKIEKQQITNEKERTESVINNMAEGIVVVDDAGKVVMMNPAAERIYGASFSQMKGKTLLEQNKEEVMITLSKEMTLSGDQQAAKEVQIQSSEGTQETIKNSTATIRTPDGKIVGIMSILNDIAKQKEMQRMQNDFMAHVTHELRSPLTAIKASLGTLSDEVTAGSMGQNVITIANRNVDRLARLINELLDATKISAGKMTVNPKPTDTAALVRDAVTSLQSWAKTKQLALICEIPENLPMISADYDRVIQVLVNLMSNGIKFTPPNGSIKVRVVPFGPIFLKIFVSDTGPGMPKEKQKHLFEKFYQLEQREKMDTPGTGLGLYIARNIVELHGGEIGCESEEGKGTTFHFTLPIIQEAPKAAASQTAAASPTMGKKKGWLSRLLGK